MRSQKVVKVILILSGVIAVLVGVGLLFMPVSVYASVGNDITGMVSLLSDLRATGGALLALGVLIALGAFVSDLTLTSLWVSIVLYLGYGLSRFFAMAMDGTPDDVLLGVTALEIVVGIANLYALKKYRQRPAW